jgi:glycerophosphoryl diester phosphodiesterase
MRTILLHACLCVSAAGDASADATVFDFSGPSPLAATSGPGVLSFRGTTSTNVEFGTASGFGLPLLPGGDSGVMLVRALSPSQGLLLDHASAPNGPHVPDGWVSNYTLVFDAIIPSSSFASWRSLFNTNLSNANDGDYFIDPSGRIGISARYNGQLQPDTWHRIAVVVGAAGGGSEGLQAEGMASAFIDGVFVGGQGGTGAAIDGGRWSAFSQPGPDILLFGDNNNETAPIYVSSVLFTTERLSQAEIAALGGPASGGVGVPGATPTVPPGTARRVGNIAHRGNSADAPENTWEAIRQAVLMGVEAVEMDIRLASDGTVVLMHDTNVNRTTPLSGNTAAFTPAQLAAADAGSWFDERYAGEPAPKLEDVLRQMKGSGVIAYLDIKLSGMADEIKTAMDAAGVAEDAVWLWAPTRARAVEYNAVFAAPRLVSGEIPASQADWDALRALGVVGVDYGLGTPQLTSPAFHAEADANGVWVSAYTVVDPGTMTSLIAAGVDKMETDYPKKLIEVMIPCPGDFIADGIKRPSDVFAYLNAYFSGALRSDFDRDGQRTPTDIFAFLGAYFFAGC